MEKFNKLLEVLASQTGKLLNIEELSNTCRLAKQTVERYLFILENTYVIRLVRPFFKNLRSELFKIPKIYFYKNKIIPIETKVNFASFLKRPIDYFLKNIK